jgi:DNA primase
VSSEQAGWTQLRTLAQRARQAGSSHQRLAFDLSPEESVVLAEVLDAALHITSAMMSDAELDLSELSLFSTPPAGA